MKLLKYFLVTVLLSLNLTSQVWLDPFLGRENVKLSEIQAVAEAHFSTIDIHQKGSGFKQYKRFEWFWQHRLMPDGTFPPASLIYQEKLKFNNSNNEKKGNKTQANDSWRHLGPFSSSGGYSGIGRVNCIRMNPHNGQLWAGTPSGGIWTSSNGGNSWQTITDNEEVITSLGVTSIAFHPSNSNIIYIASGDGDGFNTYSLGVLKSTDGGNSWKATGLSWNIDLFRTLSKILIDPSNPNIIYTAGSNGVYKSTDSGDSWTQVRTGSFKDMEFKPGDPNTIYVAGTELYRTTNGGSNWTNLTNGFPTSGVRRIAIAVSEDNSAAIYAVVGNSSGSNLKGVYLSTNSGDSFTELADNQPNMLGYEKDGDDTKGQAGYDLCIEANQDDWERVIIGGINTWRSTNAGTNWEIASMWYGNHNDVSTVHADQHDLWYDNANNTLYLANDGAVYRSTDFGDNWSWIGSGIRATQFYKFGISQLDSAVYIGGTQDNGSKVHQTNGTWRDAIGGDGFESVVDHENKNILYGSLYYGDFYKSTNSGSSFKLINDLNSNNDYDDITESGAWSTPFILNPKESSTILIGMNNVWMSKNSGDNFTKISDFNYGNNKLVEMAMSPSDTNVIYVAFSNRLYRTTNYGSTWEQMTRPGNNSISDIYVDDNNSNKLWVTNDGFSQNNKVFESTDGGSTWSNLSGNLPNIPTNTVVKQKDSDDKLWVGTDIGVYYKDDNMSDWVAYNVDFPNVIVTELEINYPNNQIYASTYGRGIWKANIPSALDVPTFTAPIDNSNGNPITNLLVDWNNITNAENYDIQISLVNNFSSFVVNQNVTNSQIVLSDLENFTKYYARVRAKSTHSQSDWTGTLSFTTIVGRVNLLTPTNNAINRSVSDKLIWQDLSGAIEYQLQVATDENFTSIIVDENLNAEEYSYNDLNYLTKYYWRVRAKDPSNNYGEWSFVRNFETKINKPTLISPSDDASNQSYDINFDWSDVAGANEYNFQLAENSNFNNPIINKNATVSNENVEDLAGYKEYFWRVSAKNNGNAGDWSDIFSFKTKIETIVLSSPSDNSINQDTTIELEWNAFSYADSYDIQLDLVNTFDGPNLISENSTQVNRNFVDLLYDTVYYWRVRARADANEGNWSSIFSFRTRLKSPQLILPNNTAKDQEISGILDWNNSANNSISEIQLSTNAEFSDLVINQTISETEINYSNLDYYRTYYWRTKSKRNQYESYWSEIRNFVTKIGTTTLLQPVDESINIHTTIGFSWANVSYAQGYTFHLSLSENFDSQNLIEINNTSNLLSQSNLLLDTVYYWRVRINAGGNSGDWSETFSFRTKLHQPQLTEPINNAIEAPTAGNMNWNSESNNTDFRVQISEDLNFTQTKIDKLVINTVYAYSGLENDKKYYWRVRAERGMQLSDWSSTFSFNTPSTIDRPQLNYPSNMQRNIEISELELKWLKLNNVTSYSIQISNNSNFTDNIIDLDNLIDNKFNFSGLNYNKVYYWRVKGVRDGGNESEWSVVWEFSTMLPATTLILPTNNKIDQDYIGEFKWNPVSGATTYNIELSKDEQFTTLVSGYPKISNTVVLGFENLEEKTKYYWRVNAENKLALSSWSETWNFETKGMKSSVLEFDELCDVTISPNPFDEMTNINIKVKNTTSIYVYLTDLKGRTIKVLTNEIFSSGANIDYTLHKENLSSGIYFVNIKIKEITKSFKIIIN